MAKICIVEDDTELAKSLERFLSENDYSVNIISDFDNVADQLLNSDADLVLLDIGIPNLNGKQILRKVREKSKIPIIMLTSHNSEIDEIVSMGYGADDYVTKPYNPQILLLRIEAILKRANPNSSDLIEHDGLIISLAKSSAQFAGKEAILSKNELGILNFLLKQRGKIVARSDIMDYLWSDDQFVDDNTLTVNINRLRTKLSEIGLDNLIQTRRAQGYLIE